MGGSGEARLRVRSASEKSETEMRRTPENGEDAGGFGYAGQEPSGETAGRSHCADHDRKYVEGRKRE